MMATTKWLAILAMAVMAGDQAWADASGNGIVPPLSRAEGWERVGAAGNPAQSVVTPANSLAPGEGGLQARKVEMVRRMFWIVLAHR